MAKLFGFAVAVLLAGGAAQAAPKGKAKPQPAKEEAPKAPPPPPQDIEGPSLLHTPIREAEHGKELVIRADIDDPSGVFQPLLYWRAVGVKEYGQIPLESQGANHYFAAIAGPKVQGDIEYFLEAYDSQGNGPTRVGSSERPIRIKIVGEPAAAPPSSPSPPRPLALAAPPVERVPAETPEDKLPLGPLVTAGGGVILAAVGAVLFIGASSTISELDSKYEGNAGRTPADAEATRAAISRGNIGSILMIAGGAAALGGAAWWLIPSGGPGGGALALHVRF